jgi:hypothetical protein
VANTALRKGCDHGRSLAEIAEETELLETEVLRHEVDLNLIFNLQHSCENSGEQLGSALTLLGYCYRSVIRSFAEAPDRFFSWRLEASCLIYALRQRQSLLTICTIARSVVDRAKG